MKRVSKNIEDTEQIAKIFLEEILNLKESNKGAFVVGLSGDLGAGKTAFTQAISKHLGIKNKILSPTFVIMKKYELKNKKYDFLFHLDAYRLKNEKELLHLGWEEIISDRKNLVLIEWPENVSKIMPKNTKYIHISDLKNGEKLFHFK